MKVLLQAIFAKLNTVLVELVNQALPIRPPNGVAKDDPAYQTIYDHFATTLNMLHQFYANLGQVPGVSMFL